MAVRNDVSVDWSASPRIILIAAPATEVSVQDLVDTCRNIEAMPAAMDDSHLIDATGKQSLGGGAFVGITLKLRNAKVKFGERGVPETCSVFGGNLVAVDENGDAMLPIEPSSNVTAIIAQSSSPTLIVSSSSTPVPPGGLTQEEHGWLEDISTLAGAGRDSVTICLFDEWAQSVPDTDVWVQMGAKVVAGTLQTDSEGQVMFFLDAGTAYTLFRRKDGVRFLTNPSTFVAIAD